MAEEQVIIDIEVSSQEAVQNILAARQAVAELTAKKKELADANELDASTEEQLTAQIKVQNDAIRANQKVLQDNIKQQQALDGSLNSLRSQLRNLVKQYDNLSRTEREGAKGTELLQHIKDVTAEVKDAEAESGRFQRNVGNYPQVFDLAGGTMSKFVGIAQRMGEGTRGMGGAFTAAKGAVSSFGKQLLKLLANPIVAIIAGIAAVVMGVVNAFKKNDEASTKLASGFSALKPIVQGIKAIFSALAAVIGTVVEAIGKVIRALLSLIPAYKKAADAALDLVQATDRLEDAEREYTVQHAKRDAQVSELRNKANDSEKYSFEQRVGFLEESMRLEQEDLKARLVIAKEKLRLAQMEAKMNSDTSDETKNKLAELQAAIYEAEKDYNDGTRRMQKQLIQFRKEERQRQAAAAKSAAEARKEAQRKELEETRALQDALVNAMAEGAEKAKAQARMQTQRTVEDLKKRLSEEKNLTVKARQAINERIVLLEANLQLEIENIDKEAARERLTKMTETATEYWNARLSLAKKGSEEERKAREMILQSENAAERRALQQRLVDGELSEEQYETMLKAADKRTRDELAAIDKEAHDEEVQRIRLEWENKINAELEGSEERYKAIIEQRRWELDNLHQMEDESDEEFKQRRLQAEKNYTDSMNQYAAERQRVAQEKALAVASVTGSLSELLAAAAGDNKEMARAAKLLALGEVAVSQGVAIAKGVAEAMATPFPANIASIATVVSSVMAVMTAALNTINSAEFATGGVIHGAGTGTSDSIVARVSNGESVINAKSTAKYYDLLSAINQDGGGVAFSGAVRRSFATGGYVSFDSQMAGVRAEEMRQLVREAAASVQPVVSVREITKVAQRVQVKQAIAKQL